MGGILNTAVNFAKLPQLLRPGGQVGE